MASRKKKTEADLELAAAADDVDDTERALEAARAANAAAHARYQEADVVWQAQEADRRRAAQVGTPGPNQTLGA